MRAFSNVLVWVCVEAEFQRRVSAWPPSTLGQRHLMRMKVISDCVTQS